MSEPIPTVEDPPALPVRLERGTVVGRYEIDGWVRDGGMASLYRGHHVKTGARVAIKIQLTGGHEDLVTAARFDREGEVMGRLSGVPNVVQVQDVDELPDGRRYLVMEWIEGDNLEEVLDDLRNDDELLALDRGCRLLKDVALALVAVHNADVVHRDLKPSNIMVDRSHPDREVAKLVDFGISADLGSGGQTGELTATGVVLGTSGYVAPEQAIGLPADPGFDVFSFGVVMFESLTGYRLPPEGMGPEQLPPASRLRKSIPNELASLIDECLQRNPTKRPSSAAQVVDRLDGILAGLEQNRRPSTANAEVMPQPASHHRASSDALRVEDVQRLRSERVSLTSTTRPTTEPPVEDADDSQRNKALLLGIVVLAIALVVVWRCQTAEEVDPLHPAERALAVLGSTASPSGDSSASMVATSSTSLGATSTGGGAEFDEGSDSSGTGAEPAQNSTGVSDWPEIDDGAKTPSLSTNRKCASNRRKADGASERRDWSALLRATSDRRCWSSAGQRKERTALRVQALAELGRYTQCVTEGAGSTDPRVASRTKFCRNRMPDIPG